PRSNGALGNEGVTGGATLAESERELLQVECRAGCRHSPDDNHHRRNNGQGGPMTHLTPKPVRDPTGQTANGCRKDEALLHTPIPQSRAVLVYRTLVLATAGRRLGTLSTGMRSPDWLKGGSGKPRADPLAGLGLGRATDTDLPAPADPTARPHRRDRACLETRGLQPPARRARHAGMLGLPAEWAAEASDVVGVGEVNPAPRD